MIRAFQVLVRNSFVRSVSVLVGGTALGQAVAVAALPVLTRLYTPEDFSVLAVYSGLLGIFGLIACLRFDIAIPLPVNQQDAANLLVLSLAIAATFSGLIAIPCLLVPAWVAGILRHPGIESYLWLVPLGVLFMGTYSALQFWVTRNKDFRLIARSRMMQSIGGAITQLGLGWAESTPLGLIAGQLVSSGAGSFGFAYSTLKSIRINRYKISLTEMHRLSRLYDRFPKYSMIEAFANIAAIQVPVLIIAGSSLGPEAGHLALAMRVMQVPMGLIGGAIGQVYLSRAPEEYRAGNLSSFSFDILGGLLKSGVGPLAFAGIAAPLLFVLVFGQNWERAGELVSWMSPWFIFQFIVSPISMALHVTGNQRVALIIQVFGFLLRAGLVILAVMLYRTLVAEIYAVTGVIFYIIYFGIVMKVVGCRVVDLVKQIKFSLIYIMPWIIGGILFNYFFKKILYG